MNEYGWLNDFCMSFKGAKKEFKVEWLANIYIVGDKIFALIGYDKTNRPIITLKLEPSIGDLFRSNYKDVIPGYYMNKLHWNSIYLDGTVPKDIIKEMIAESYSIILKSLTKKVRDKIQGNL